MTTAKDQNAEGATVSKEWIRALVADFGSECRERLRVSDTEASISLPVAKLVENVGARWKLNPRLHPEYPLPGLRMPAGR